MLFVLALAYFVLVGRRHPGREEQVLRDGVTPAADHDTAAGAEPVAENETGDEPGNEPGSAAPAHDEAVDKPADP